MSTTKHDQNNELQLIEAIRQGDKEAENTLFMNNYNFMKKAHDFGPDGIYSHAKKSLRSKFEDMLADIYVVFLKCVATYDPARSSFQTHLGFRMRMAAKDRIRNKEKEKDVTISLDTNEPFDGILTETSDDSISPFSKATAAWKARHDAAEREHDRNFALIDRIVDAFGEDSIEARYVELFCDLGRDEKKHTNEICLELNCSRQTLSNIKKRIKSKFGSYDNIIPLGFDDSYDSTLTFNDVDSIDDVIESDEPF